MVEPYWKWDQQRTCSKFANIQLNIFLKKTASNFPQMSRLLIRPRSVEKMGCEGDKRNSRAPLLACLVIDTPGEGGTERNLKEAKTGFSLFFYMGENKGSDRTEAKNNFLPFLPFEKKSDSSERERERKPSFSSLGCMGNGGRFEMSKQKGLRSPLYFRMQMVSLFLGGREGDTVSCVFYSGFVARATAEALRCTSYTLPPFPRTERRKNKHAGFRISNLEKCNGRFFLRETMF